MVASCAPNATVDMNISRAAMAPDAHQGARWPVRAGPPTSRLLVRTDEGPPRALYTEFVALALTRLVGAVLAVGLSGAPAAAAACATACLPGMRHSASASMPAGSAGDAAAEPPGHEHHHPAPAAASFALGLEATSAVVPTSTHACCPEALTLVASSTAALRADARALLATSAVAPALLHPLPAVPVTLVACAPAAERCRPPARLVLRI